MPETYSSPATFISASDLMFTYIRDDIGHKQCVNYPSSDFKTYVLDLHPGQRILMTWKVVPATGPKSLVPETLIYMEEIGEKKEKKLKRELVEV